MAATMLTPEQHLAQQQSARRAAALEKLQGLIADADELVVPPPVMEVRQLKRGVLPLLPAEALELARQVYFERYGSLRDAGRAIIQEGLAETDDLVVVTERLQTWWRREGWSKRSTKLTLALRDVAHDGGLYRGDRLCKATATGGGPAPVGKPCAHTALADSDYCYHHDPRPEYVERRAAVGREFVKRRRADMVPVDPLRRFFDEKRKQLLEEARADGRRLDPKQTGWMLLSEAIGVDQTTLWRIREGIHSGGQVRALNSGSSAPRERGVTTKIRASTVVRYLEPLDVGFEDIYGFAPPLVDPGRNNVCPKCGGYKSHDSAMCRDCWDAGRGERCQYVNLRGVRCPKVTRHQSGYCQACRRIVEHVPVPKDQIKRRQHALTPRVLTLATGEWPASRNLAWVAARLWAANVDDVRSSYKGQGNVRGMLVKVFRHQGWTTAEAIAEGYRELVSSNGEVDWPPPLDALVLEPKQRVPAGPFLVWLDECYREYPHKKGTFKAMAERMDGAFDPDRFGPWLQGRRLPLSVQKGRVDRALAAWPGPSFEELYG